MLPLCMEYVTSLKFRRLLTLIPLSIQHVLAMYAGTVAVPLFIGQVLIRQHLLTEQDLPQLLVADLFVSGISSLIQSLGWWKFGARLPLMQGCTFASASVMISTSTYHNLGTMYGSVIACGIFMILCAGYFARILRFFPPLVIGTIITIIGLSLISVASTWIGSSDISSSSAPTPATLGLALATIIIILLLEKFTPPIWQKLSILLGIIAGTTLAIPLHMVKTPLVYTTSWWNIPQPFHFGIPQWNTGSIVAMLIVGIIIMTETSSDLVAVGEITGTKISPRTLAAGLRNDGLSTILGGVFNTFPYTAYAQNIGLLSLTKVTSRYVTALAGIWLIILGFLPKIGAIVSSIPSPVLGGAGMVLFGMITANGIKIITEQHLNHYALITVGLSISIALLPVINPTIFTYFPHWFTTIFSSSITLGTITAVLLNLLFFSRPSPCP